MLVGGVRLWNVWFGLEPCNQLLKDAMFIRHYKMELLDRTNNILLLLFWESCKVWPPGATIEQVGVTKLNMFYPLGYGWPKRFKASAVFMVISIQISIRMRIFFLRGGRRCINCTKNINQSRARDTSTEHFPRALLLLVHSCSAASRGPRQGQWMMSAL